ncbi:MAG: response regulator, partial [Clostridia bacterium]|nr:response regulator [Clostridia bacterium]
MYKVFLVDDEIVIRESIRSNVRWDKQSLSLCGEAPDCEIALSMIQELKPDILVTDIRTPFMDGMELCRNVAATMPWMHIVILSGHDDFAYAKEAISLGVKEYLLKPVSAQDLEQVLCRIAANIQQERARQADINELKRQVDSSQRLMRENCLTSLLEGLDEREALAQARKIRMNLLANYYLIMLIAFADTGRFLTLRGMLERAADGYGGAVHLCARGDQVAVLVMGDTVADLEERAYAFAQAVKHEVERDGDVGLRVSIGESVEALSGLQKSMASAVRVLSSTGQRKQIIGTADVGTFVPPDLMELNMAPLYEQLQYVDAVDAMNVIRSYLEPIGEALAQSSLMTHYVIVDIKLAASRIVRQCGCDPVEILPELQHMGGLHSEQLTFEEILWFAGTVMKQALDCRDKHSPMRHSAAVRKACQYIETNYHRPEIMLRDIAEHVQLSNNHFCTVFSQEMGMTFIEYLTQLR